MVWESVHGMYVKAVCFKVVCEGDFGMLLFVLLSVDEGLEVRFFIGL